MTSHSSIMWRNLVALGAVVALHGACGDLSGPGAGHEVAYVTNFGSNTVSVIDVQADTVTTTVNVGEAPHGITATPDGRLVYVANLVSEDVTVIETAGNTVIATIPTGPSGLGIATDPSGSIVYQALVRGLDAVAVISTAANTVTTMVEVGNVPTYVIFHPDGSRAYVSNYASNTVSVMETTTHTVAETIDLNGVIEGPYGTAFSPGGALLYVTGFDRNGRIAVVETSTGDVVDVIEGTPSAVTIAVTHEGSRAYVALNRIRLAVFDLPSDSLLTTIPIEAWALASARRGAAIYATTSADNVAVIDTRRNAVARRIPVGDTPGGIAIARIRD